MKKFERELSIFFITSVPCFVLTSVFFLLVKEEVIFSIIALLFSLFLVCVCSLLRRESILYTENVRLKRDKETAYQKNESLYIYIEELQEQVRELEENECSYKSQIEDLMKKQKDLETACKTKGEEVHSLQSTALESGSQNLRVSCNLEALKDKKELTSEDRFTITRNGRGVMVLKDSKQLLPDSFKCGEKVSSDMHNQWKSYSMQKLFDSNSQDMIEYEIMNIIPAQIQVLEKLDDNTFRGVLIRKGSIELKKNV